MYRYVTEAWPSGLRQHPAKMLGEKSSGRFESFRLRMERIEWQAAEFEKHEKPASWFVALWIIAAGLVAVAFITESLFMGILVLVAALIVSLYAAKDPQTIAFSLDDKSFSIEGKPYPLESFSSFWIFEREESNLLSLAPKGLRPAIKVALPKEHTADTRLLLRAVMEEKEQEESAIEALADWLRF